MIFVLTIGLVFVFDYTYQKNQAYTAEINSLLRQKDFTQEISKHIFYSYQKKESHTKDLNTLIKTFIKHIDEDSLTQNRDKSVLLLWNKFYLEVQKYRDISKAHSPYSNILLQNIVTNIYNTNLELMVLFDRYIKDKKQTRQKNIFILNIIEYGLFLTLIALLIYLFFQLKDVVGFIQNFINRSKQVLESSSIKELRAIELSQKDEEAQEAQDNFNALILNIENSIATYSKNIEISNSSLLLVEKQIEELFTFMHDISKSPRDKKLILKEDLVIQSLEELSVCVKKISSLKENLKNLINHKN